MKFYGVGVKFDGAGDNPKDMLDYFCGNSCWLGHDKGVKPKQDRTINDIPIGSIIVAKSYATISMRYYYIRAIGIVIGKELPDNVINDYPNKMGVKVVWIKRFNKHIPLPAKDYQRGTYHTKTIFPENNESMILKVEEIMKFDYKPEV